MKSQAIESNIINYWPENIVTYSTPNELVEDLILEEYNRIIKETMLEWKSIIY